MEFQNNWIYIAETNNKKLNINLKLTTMKTTNFYLSILIVLISFTSLSAAKIEGKIIDKNKKGIAKAKIVLFKDLKAIDKTISGKSGFYSLQAPTGTYSIEVKAPGFYPINTKITVSNKPIEVFNIEMKRIETVTIEAELEDLELDIVENSPVSIKYEKLCTVEQPRGAKSNNIAGNAMYIQADASYPVHNREGYDAINENIFKDVITAPLSTFSVDVDKAAYSNVRRFLNNNRMPVKDAVRIEEMINYFSYDYKKPTGEHPFSVNTEFSSCPWNDKNKLLLVGLQGETPDEKEIPASNLVFLIDVSGSMNYHNKLPLLKQAFKILVDKLRPKDRVAIVVYAGAAGTVLESTSGLNKRKIIASLDNLQAGGSTAGGAGINAAYKIASENFIRNGNNRVILATDGDFNVGASSNAEMVRLIEKKRQSGIFLSVLGFGTGNYQDSKMEQISNAGNGNYAYIDNILEAKKVFGKELWGTLFTIAKDVKIQIEFNPAYVKSYRLIGYENRMLNNEDFNDDKKDAGEIGAGHTVTALYEIVPQDDVKTEEELNYRTYKIKKSNDLMTLKLRYKKPDEDKSNLIEHKVKYEDTQNPQNLLFASAVAEFGMLLRNSDFKNDATYASVLERASAFKNNDEFGYKSDFIKLVETASLLDK